MLQMNKWCLNCNLFLYKFVFIILLLHTNAIAASVNDSNAAQLKELILDYKKPISIELSSNFINRLNFQNNRIVKIIGDESKFTKLLSSDGSNLFITSKMPASSEFDISVIDMHGKVFDLHFILKETLSPTLASLHRKDTDSKDESILQLKASEMINAMSRGVIDKYYVETVSNIHSYSRNSSITLKQYNIYRFDKLWGSSFEIRNKSKKNSVMISEEDIASLFKNLIAIKLERNVLKPSGKTKVFIVFKRDEL